MTTTTIEARASIAIDDAADAPRTVTMPAPPKKLAKKKPAAKKKVPSKVKAKAKQAPSSPPSGSPSPSAPPPKVVEAEGFSSPLLRDLANESPFWKVGVVGFAGSGKSRAVLELAIGIHTRIKSRKPIALAMTEKAERFAIPRLAAAGIRPQVMRSRSLSDLSRLLEEVAGVADVLVVDSLTAYWEDLVVAYKRKQQVSDLGPADWVALKGVWHERFSRPFVDAGVHILFAGRAGYEYADVKDADGNYDNVKVGMKLRAEAETAFEVDFLLEMERVDIGDLEGVRTVRRARVIKDRSDVVDGCTFDNITFANVVGAFDAAVAGARAAQPVEESSAADLFGDQRSDRREQLRLVADIKNELNRAWGTLTVPGKAKRAAALTGSFGTATWERIEVMEVARLRLGLALLRQVIADGGPFVAPPFPPATTIESIRSALTSDDDDDDEPTRHRKLIAAHSLASTLTEPLRTEADALIDDASRRFTGSGGARASGGKRLSVYEAR